MVYPFLTLDDGTEIVHSEYHDDGRVKVYMETADEVLGFKHATLWLSSYEWEDIYGYSEDDVKRFRSRASDNPVIEGRRLWKCPQNISEQVTVSSGSDELQYQLFPVDFVDKKPAALDVALSHPFVVF